MIALFSTKSQNWIYLFLALALVVYLAFRVNLVPMVHDEGVTFAFYIQTGKFWFYNAHWDANNHVLNSVLTWISYKFFGDSLPALRLPNLLSFLLFLFYVWKTGQNYLEGFKKHAFILALWFCHIYFEHFGYARGYGMSFAFLAAALFYLLELARNKSLTNLGLLLIFILLAMFANLTLLPLGTTIIAWSAFLWFNELRQRPISNVIVSIAFYVCSAGIIAYFAKFSFELKDRGLLYYGGQEGLVHDTLQSVAMGLFRIDNWWFGIGLLVLMVVSIAPFPVMLFRNGIVATTHSAYGIFAGLLLTMLTSFVLLNLLVGVNYPTYRTAIYLIPLFFGALAFWPSIANRIHPSFALPVFAILFIIQANTSYAWYWKWERMTPELYETALKNLPKQEYPPLTGGYHLLGLRWALYGYHHQEKMGQWSADGYPSLIPDVQIVFPNDVSDYWKQFYTEVDRDEFSDFPLYIRKEPCPRKWAQQESTNEVEIAEGNEFMDLLVIDNPLQEAHMAGVKMKLEASWPHQEIQLVISIHDESGSNLGYQAMPIHWHYDDLSDVNIEASIFLAKPEKQAVQMKVYLWNMSKRPFRIKASETKLFELYPEGLPELEEIKTE
jgi:hypothetical protein